MMNFSPILMKRRNSKVRIRTLKGTSPLCWMSQLAMRESEISVLKFRNMRIVVEKENKLNDGVNFSVLLKAFAFL